MNPYQDLLKRLQTAQGDEDRAWITLQFNLDTQPEAIRKAVQTAAVLHWFDRETLRFVREAPLTEAEFSALVSLPYVEEFPERGWNVHEKTRELLRDKLWREDRALYRKLSRRAAAWCRKYHSADPVWQAETAYHALLADERKAVQTFISLGLDWLNRFQYAALEALLRPVLNSVRAGRLEGRPAAWTWFLQAQLDSLFSRNREAQAALLRALDIPSGDLILTAHCIHALGGVHDNLSELPQARERYEAALPIYRAIGDRQGEANCIQGLGRVHNSLSELPQARGCFHEALPIFRAIGNRLGEANCIRALGKVHAILSELPQARGRYEEALPIYRAIGARLGEANCIHALGDVHGSLSELPQARERYEEALPIYRAIGVRHGEANCIQGLGEVHAILSELPQARGRFEEALATFCAIGDRLGEANCIHALGDVHERLSELPQARGRYEEALPIYRAIGARLGEANCIHALGHVHESLSELPQARERYEEALPIYHAIGERLGETNCVKSLGEVAGEEGKQDEALAYFSDAVQRYGALGIAAAEANGYDSMGIFYNNVQRYPEALAAFGRAIEIFPYVDYYTNRAEPHMHLGDFSAAQRDLEAAFALNPDFDYLHFNRGRLALWQGQAQVALEHFDRALTQRPEYGEFHLWRALALAMNGAAWEETLQAGLTRTHLVRQIKEVAEALDKLVQNYGATPLEDLRLAMQAALAERIPTNGK